jgi:hypothetical protein
MSAAQGADGFIRILFTSANQGSAAGAPLAGQCAWSDRAFRPGEPLMLVFPSNGANAGGLLQATKAGGRFDLHAYNNGQGALVVASVDATAAATSPPQSPPPATVPPAFPQPVPPSNFSAVTATATTAVNVRSGPSSTSPVIAVLQGGASVAVAGCSNGWCALAQPFGIQQGWVAQQFLAFAGGAVAPQPSG